jgi:phosphoglycerate kinase
MKTIKDIDIAGKRVLLRCDLNVPIQEGKIQDDFRIAESIPSVQYIVEQGAKCIVVSHLNKPETVFDTGEKIPKEKSLALVAERLEELLGKKVWFFQDPIGSEELEQKMSERKSGEVVLLENIRFYKGEKENSEDFAKKLAALADIYVNDAFAVCHRAHTSVEKIAEFLPHTAGLLIEKEVHALEQVRDNPEKPMVTVVGGAKVETKASFLKHMSKHADAILLGNLLSKEVKEQGLSVEKTAEVVYVIDGVDGDFDLGPETVGLFKEKIQRAKTIFWAGPLGMIEDARYEKGSLEIAKAIIESGAFAVAGGGDLAAFLNKHNLRGKFAHVSTGGGAMLAFLAGETLPGLEALEK